MKKKKKHYKPVRESNFWSSNFIEYESNGDQNKTLSVEDIINNLKKQTHGKFNQQIFSIDNDEERITHSKSNNIVSNNMINDEVAEIIEKFFESFKKISK